MSPQSSDSLFDSGDFQSGGGFDSPADASGDSGQLQESFATRPAVVQKQPFGVYNVMLILSLLAMIAAAVLFYIEVGRFQ